MEFYAIKKGQKGNRKIIDVVQKEHLQAYIQEHKERLKVEAEEGVQGYGDRCTFTPLEWFMTDREFGWRCVQQFHPKKTGLLGLSWKFDKTKVEDFEQKRIFSVQYKPMTFWSPKPEVNVEK